MSTQFTVTVVHQDAVTVAGIKVRTSMAQAATDCPALWEHTFGPRMNELAACGTSVSYGVSTMVDVAAGTFDYWAALPVASNVAIPNGMERCVLPAGLYAQCAVPSLEHLKDAYAFLYEHWLPAQQEYAMSMEAPCYELYPADFMQTGTLFIYTGVIKK